MRTPHKVLGPEGPMQICTRNKVSNLVEFPRNSNPGGLTKSTDHEANFCRHLPAASASCAFTAAGYDKLSCSNQSFCGHRKDMTLVCHNSSAQPEGGRDKRDMRTQRCHADTSVWACFAVSLKRRRAPSGKCGSGTVSAGCPQPSDRMSSTSISRARPSADG